MNKHVKKILCVETIIILVFIIIRLLLTITGPRGHESYFEDSPSGEYHLSIHGSQELGWPFGADSYSIALYGEDDEHGHAYRASMHVVIPNAGKKATYTINWEQEYVEIVFEKRDKSHVYYRLPLKECE